MPICHKISFLKKFIRGLYLTAKNPLFMRLVIKSHLNTSNIYVRRAIILENLNEIDLALNSSTHTNIKSSIYWDIVAKKKEQKAILSNLNKEIKRSEQASFPFNS